MKKRVILFMLVTGGLCFILLLAGIVAHWPTRHVTPVPEPTPPSITANMEADTAIALLTDYHLKELLHGLMLRLQNKPADFRENLRTAMINFSMWGPLKKGSEWGLCSLGDHAWLRNACFFAMPLVRWMSEPFLFAVPVKIKEGRTVYDLSRVMQLIRDRHQAGIDVSLDNVGDASLSEQNATDYCDYYIELMDAYANADIPYPLYVSLKLSALTYDLEALADKNDAKRCKEKYDELREALHRLLAHSASLKNDKSVFFRIDMEEYAYKDATLELFHDLVERYPDLTGRNKGRLNIGVVIQAYLRDSDQDMHNIAKWAEQWGVPVPIRLVKGAYLEHERAVALAEGYPSPVWDIKPETDACFERLTRYIMTTPSHFEAAIATHNLRSQAYAFAIADYYAISPEAYEIQMLYGMGAPIKDVLVEQGVTLREYVPAGPLSRGLKYAGRRFDELASQDNALSRTLRGKFPVADDSKTGE